MVSSGPSRGWQRAPSSVLRVLAVLPFPKRALFPYKGFLCGPSCLIAISKRHQLLDSVYSSFLPKICLLCGVGRRGCEPTTASLIWP